MIIGRKGNGQTECYGCKQKGKFILHWDCFLYTYDNKAYCSDCLLEKLDKENQELKKQQKEFIEWLENLINNANKVLDNPKEDEEIKSYVLSRKFVLEHVLSQYKEIIGVDNE